MLEWLNSYWTYWAVMTPFAYCMTGAFISLVTPVVIGFFEHTLDLDIPDNHLLFASMISGLAWPAALHVFVIFIFVLCVLRIMYMFLN